ncbi:MAG: hypothetical protein ACREXP_16970 [Steroidobacteraceae bacterium]
MNLFFQMPCKFKKIEHAAAALERYQTFQPALHARSEGGFVLRIPGGQRPHSVLVQLRLQTADGTQWELWGIDDDGSEICIRRTA